MRILTRYVLFDLLKVFLLTLSGLTLLIFVVLIGKEAVDKGIGLGPLLQMCPYLLPQAMQFAVPGTMLLAATSVYGRMASYNEIVAIKSLGISPMVLIWPTLVLATLVSFRRMVLNDVAVSWGRLGVQRVFLASIEEVTYGQLRMRHTYNLGKAQHHRPRCRRPSTDRPTLIVQASGDGPPATVSAHEAELRLLPEEGKLVVEFDDFDMTAALQLGQIPKRDVRCPARRANRLEHEEPQPVDLRAGRNRAGDRRAAETGPPASSRHERPGRVRHADGRFRLAFRHGLAGP